MLIEITHTHYTDNTQIGEKKSMFKTSTLNKQMITFSND